MIEHFRNGDVVRVTGEPELVEKTVVFGSYGWPNEAGTGWTVLVQEDDAESPTGITVWSLDETQVVSTGFRRIHSGQTMPIGLRTPEQLGDRVGLALTTDLTNGSDGRVCETAVLAALVPFALAGRIASAMSPHPHEPFDIEFDIDLEPDHDPAAAFSDIADLCSTGWSEVYDDGWELSREWRRANAAPGATFLHETVRYARLSLQPWSSPARRHPA